MSSEAPSSAAASEQDDFWIFGYGSLIWKPPPHFDRREVGYVEGYVRRFWQASEDHRGTPEAPGRVVTLISREHWATLTDSHSTAPAQTWGAAYHIPRAHVDAVKNYLDIREINGYSIQYADFHAFSSSTPTTEASSHSMSASTTATTAAKGKPIRCLVYIGLPDNPQFLGPQDPAALAAHIVRSRGPSGENREYVYNLAAALEAVREQAGALVEVDEHVADLARRVRTEDEKLFGQGDAGVGRSDGREEVEKGSSA